MPHRYTEAIRIAERLRGRVDALSGAATCISAAVRQNMITADEVYQLLDVIADDMRRSTDALLNDLTAPSTG